MEIKQLKKLVVSGALALSATANLLAVSLPVSAGQQLGQTDFENGVGLPWHVCESITVFTRLQS